MQNKRHLASRKKDKIILIGSSGHAKVVIDLIERLESYEILGIVDSFKPVGAKLYGYEIIGCENDIAVLHEKLNFDFAFISIGDNRVREQMHLKLEELLPQLKFVTVIHDSAVIGKNVKIGQGSAILGGTVVNADASIGDFCIINTKASLGHDSLMDNFSSLAPGVTIGGDVVIGCGTSISIGATVVRGINIGKNSIVGAASLILNKVNNNALVYGSPAKFIRKTTKNDKFI